MSEQQNPMGRIVAKALKDEGFKRQLVADPESVLKAEGVAVPEGIRLKVVEDTEQVQHIVLPAAGTCKLTDSELEKVVAGCDCPVMDYWCCGGDVFGRRDPAGCFLD